MAILRSILLTVLLVTLTSAIPISKNIDVDQDYSVIPLTKTYRLPGNVKPISYTIELEPHIVENEFTFNGVSSIHIAVVENNTKTITLHASSLIIDEEYTTLVNAKRKDIKPRKHSKDADREFLKLEFENPIDVGKYILKLKYKGYLSEDSKGFYRTSYTNEKGAPVWLAATHFEPTFARRAFPCFDEPALKATFEISVKHHRKYIAISNMPVSRKTVSKDDIEHFLTEFEVTPKMSTYLVAFVISDYAKMISQDSKFSVWARNNQIENGEYALKIGQQELKLLEEYTGIKQVIPKMDALAIVDAAQGMENWGLMIFRESSFLINETDQLKSEKSAILKTIAHELAHQWFGNLVTPSWWEFTWLKEGLASYMSYIIADKVEPTWRFMDEFVVSELQGSAFVVDDSELQHAMSVSVDDPREIAKNFDTISYNKAACVIRMFLYAAGETQFKSALQNFLKKGSFGTATPDDLLDSLIEEMPKDVLINEKLKEKFSSWINQPGYPVVKASLSGTVADVTSKRYLSEQPSSQLPEDKWFIPINIATEENPSFADTQPERWLFPNTTTEFAIHTNGWYIINKQQTGYYRVNYDANNWKLLAEYLQTENYKKIHVLNRAQLLDDSFNLAKSGDLNDYNAFLDIAAYLAQEDDFVPWYPAHRAFAFLDKALRNSDGYELFKRYILKLTAKLEKTIDYSTIYEETDFEKWNKLQTIELACSAGSEICRHDTEKELLAYILGQNKLPKDYRKVVYCAGIRSANAMLWNMTFKVVGRSKDESERFDILSALGCSDDPKILKFYLQQTIDKKSTVSNYSSAILNAVYSGSATGIDVAFEFMTENLEAVNKTIKNDDKLAEHFINIAARMNTLEQVEKLKNFITSLQTKNAESAKKLESEGLSNAERNVNWGNKHIKQIKESLLTILETFATPSPNTETPTPSTNTETVSPSPATETPSPSPDAETPNTTESDTPKPPDTAESSEPDSANISVPTLPLTIFIALFARFLSRFV